MDPGVALKREQIYPSSDAEDNADDDELLGFDDHADDTSYIEESTSKKGQFTYFRWTPKSIKLLLKLRFEKDFEFSNRQRQKKNLWNDVATDMYRLGGFLISGENCDLKYRNMMQTYKKNRIKEERGRVDFINWEYYKMFKEAVGNSDRMPTIMGDFSNIEAEEASNDVSKNTSGNDVNDFKTGHLSDSAKDEEIRHSKRSCDSRKVKRNSRKRKRSPSKDLEKDSLHDEDDTNTKAASSKLKLIHTQPINDSSSNLCGNCGCDRKQLSQVEYNDCKIFGHSVGTQMLNIKNFNIRSLVKLKIQKILYMAETGKLDKVDKSSEHVSD